jgi:hypothetical protein
MRRPGSTELMAEEAYSGPPPDDVEDRSLLIVRAQLFLSSYAPLFVILAIRFDATALRVVCATLAALGILYLALVMFAVPRREQPRAYVVTSTADASGQVAGYLATYLVPFVAVPSPSAGDIAGYAILAVVVALIFVRSDLAQINPVLYLLGWRVASITTGETGCYLVCRRLPRPGTEISAVRVAGLLIRKEARSRDR